MKVLLPTHANGTRWVGHVSRALDHFLSGYQAFQLHLEQLAASNGRGDSKAKAQGFLKLIKCYDLITMALFLQDVLFVLKKVSLKFQEENSVVADMALSIKTTTAQLNVMRSKDGPFLQKLKDFQIIDAPTRGSTTRSLSQLTRGQSDLKRQRQHLLDDITEALSTHFKDTTNGLIKATSIANFKEWPLEITELQGWYYKYFLKFLFLLYKKLF